MISDDYEYIICDQEGCDERVKNHRWGKTKAEGWFFFSRETDEAWCPAHIPTWVTQWRERKAQRMRERSAPPNDG